MHVIPINFKLINIKANVKLLKKVKVKIFIT